MLYRLCDVVLSVLLCQCSPVSWTPGGCGQWTVCCVVLLCGVVSVLTSELDAGRLRAVDAPRGPGSEAGRVDGHPVLVAVDGPPLALTHHLGPELGCRDTSGSPSLFTVQGSHSGHTEIVRTYPGATLHGETKSGELEKRD